VLVQAKLNWKVAIWNNGMTLILMYCVLVCNDCANVWLAHNGDDCRVYFRWLGFGSTLRVTAFISYDPEPTTSSVDSNLGLSESDARNNASMSLTVRMTDPTEPPLKMDVVGIARLDESTEA